MGFIRPFVEEELIYSLENLRPGIHLFDDLKDGTVSPAVLGIYVFLSNTRPYHVYLGYTFDLGRRIFEQRRRRRQCHVVLFFELKGELYGEKKTLLEIERRALRTAFKRWPWATWSNEDALKVKGPDSCAHDGHPVLMALVKEILSYAEGYMEGLKGFDPKPAQCLPITHQIGSPSSEVFAMGSLTKKGMFVLKWSRLPSSVTYVKDLEALNIDVANIALGLLDQGVLNRRRWTVGRKEGIYFAQDYLVKDVGYAASLVSLEDHRPGSDWVRVRSNHPKSSV